MSMASIFNKSLLTGDMKFPQHKIRRNTKMQKGVLLFSAAVMLGLTGCMSYEEIRGKADAGDTEMQYQVGTMLSDGDGVKVDKKQAKEYLAKAMKSRHFLAACQLIDLITKSPDGDESELFKQSYDLIFSKKPQSWNDSSFPVFLNCSRESREVPEFIVPTLVEKNTNFFG